MSNKYNFKNGMKIFNKGTVLITEIDYKDLTFNKKMKIIKEVDLDFFITALNEHVRNGNKITDFDDGNEVIEIYIESNDYVEYVFESEEVEQSIRKVLNEFVSFHKENKLI